MMRGWSQRKKIIWEIIFSEGWFLLGAKSIPNGWADSTPLGVSPASEGWYASPKGWGVD
jgi:hypothetical protein